MMANRLMLMLAVCLLGGGVAAHPSGLSEREFGRYWQVESEAADYAVSFRGDTCELTAPKGLTLWRKEVLHADCAVEYDVCIVDEGRDGDRLSDMNCFWLASLPSADGKGKGSCLSPLVLGGDKGRRWRNGIFTRCYTLQMYYLGYGGNYNTTTRFRRYTGDEAGVLDESRRPPVLVEYTDSAHLLRANHWYHVKLQTAAGRTQMWVDGECVVSYLDPEPLAEGWFGFRTTLSRCRITHFRSYAVERPSARSGIPLHWVGEAPQGPQPVTLGIPFAAGEQQDVSRLTLAGGIPTDAWVNARWPDGSVKWAGMAAVVPAGGTLSVAEAKGGAVQAPSMVSQTPRQLVVTTDSLRAYIPRQGAAVIDSLLLGDVRVAGPVHLVATTADADFTSLVDSVAVERSGRVLTVIRLSGRHHSATRSWLPFVLRLYFFRGSPQVKLVHTFLYDGDQRHDRLTSLGVRFSVPMRQAPYNRHVAFATDDGGVWAESVQPLGGRRTLSVAGAQALQEAGRHVALSVPASSRDSLLLHDWAAWDGFRLSQLTDNAFSIRKRAVSPSSDGREETPWIGTFTGRRAPGYVFVGDTDGGLAVGMKDFWQSYPSTIQIDHARSGAARLTMYLWSPEAEPMNLCHYDTVAHGLQASYEDVQEGLSTPYGIGRTTTLWLLPQSACPGRETASLQARRLEADPHLLPTPEYLHRQRAFGIWSLPGGGDSEQRLTQYLDFYRDAVEQHKWYGFWNYGDLMHAYDPERHSWRYDVGGYAWDNTELATPMWLWYSFLRTGRADVWLMAEAMTRHNAEVDTYHLGPLAPLGSRHNVSHWGCGAKEARISQSAFLRFYYYLTGGDERTGELMHAQTDADTLLYHLDPMRLAEPRSKFPCTAPARLRFGPDWLAYAGNWMTEWERTGNLKYRDKILAGLQSVSQFKNGLFTGNKALGYDPATGVISYEGPADRLSTNHLCTIMGGFEVMSEFLLCTGQLPALSAQLSRFKSTWLDYALRYKPMARQVTGSRFPVRRLLAYAAWQTRSPQLAREAWTDLWGRIEHEAAPEFRIDRIGPPLVPAPVDEWHGLSTNDAALWSLDAIYMLETLPNAETP